MQEQQLFRALLNPLLDWPALRVACVVLSSVRSGEEPFERSLPDLIVHRCRPLFLQDFVAVNLQDVVDTADAQTFLKEGELCLRILAMLDAIVHCTDDFCLVQELVRDELPRSDSNSECDATVCNCRGLGQAPDVASFPLKRCCVQVVHVVDYFCLQCLRMGNAVCAKIPFQTRRQDLRSARVPFDPCSRLQLERLQTFAVMQRITACATSSCASLLPIFVCSWALGSFRVHDVSDAV